MLRRIELRFIMKIAFGMIIFNGNYVLKEVLESVYPYATQILIAEGPVKFWQEQGFTTSTDGTNEILDSFPDPENKITIVHSQYSEKDEQCNAYMEYIQDDIDILWNLDSDEVFKPQDIETVINLFKTEKYTSAGFKSISFFGGFNNYLTGFEESAEFKRVFRVFPGSIWKTHRPPTIKYKQGVIEKHLSFNTLANDYGIRMYHYSYVFPQQVFQKVNYYKQAVSKDLCIDNYFNKIYLPWVCGSKKQKASIEQTYQGVHEFILQYRGPCFTMPFTDSHPVAIKNNLMQLKEKFNEQLRQFN